MINAEEICLKRLLDSLLNANPLRVHIHQNANFPPAMSQIIPRSKDADGELRKVCPENTALVRAFPQHQQLPDEAFAAVNDVHSAKVSFRMDNEI